MDKYDDGYDAAIKDIISLIECLRFRDWYIQHDLFIRSILDDSERQEVIRSLKSEVETMKKMME